MMTARTLRTSPTLGQRLRRLVTLARVSLLRFEIACLADEREHYRALGMVGPVYLRESYSRQRQLMGQVRELEAGL
jgi:hypothetical protein